MLCLTRRLAAAVFLILVVSTWLIAEQSTRTGKIRGRATDLFGFPVSGAVVEILTESSERPLQTRSDINGSYEFKNVPAEQLTIRIDSVGFLREERRTRLADDETLLVDFGLEAGRLTDLPIFKVRGTVYGPQNIPLKDATVRITNGFKTSLVFVARTDGHGRYLSEIDTPGQYVVSVLKSGYVISTKTVLLMPDLPRKDASVNFMLEP
ncbi:MAG TPA: carboxypeptidase-like regulatory domain-containing protein, partial [Pyrinomonadaceae bacterium]